MNSHFTYRMLLVLICFVFSTKLQAHSGSLRGIIYDANGHKPIEGANLYIRATNSSAVTDAFGKFFLKGIEAGKYKVIVSCVGFENMEDEVKIEDGVTTDLVFNL